nr:triphosphoribosyl-dephospho-CoA synthase [Bordetella genomosp. 9]
MLWDPIARTDVAQYLAEQAVAALIDEATLAPKPGLVDFRSSGAHTDLSWPLMCASARALQPAFATMALAALDSDDLPVLRRRIGCIGREGERAMLHATRGVNTHRGAIWAIGLLVTAAARSFDDAHQKVAVLAGALARIEDPGAPLTTGHKGERARLIYGVGGAKGQARAGFPHVVSVALPTLRRSRAAGDMENAARLNALLSVMATLDDTCVLARGGTAALACVQDGAKAVLAAGGAGTLPGRTALRELEMALLERNVSPGGAADLLAAALFLDRLGNEHTVDATATSTGEINWNV